MACCGPTPSDVWRVQTGPTMSIMRSERVAEAGPVHARAPYIEVWAARALLRAAAALQLIVRSTRLEYASRRGWLSSWVAAAAFLTATSVLYVAIESWWRWWLMFVIFGVFLVLDR